MSWDTVWEKIYRSRKWGRYPPEELVRFVARHYYDVPERSKIRFLELGCGPGSGPSWFIAREGFALAGIDGSAAAIEQAKERFLAEGLRAQFVVGQLDSLPWPDGSFDCAVDVGSLQCNTEAETRAILREVNRVLKPGGRHFSIASRAGTWGDGAGSRLDATTLSSVSEGPFASMGKIRFATRESLDALYANFTDVALEHSTRSYENGTREISNWVLTCRKRG
jgi:ubiquinone/menaquinone biosynthesis C-methylase UbiE